MVHECISYVDDVYFKFRMLFLEQIYVFSVTRDSLSRDLGYFKSLR